MRRLFLVILILSYGAPAFLQIIDMKFTGIANEEKLSGSFASCITQDTTGYIWIGTTNGLNRYDGYDFRIYQADPEDKTSLVSNNIFCLFNDSRDRLWIGSDFGICIYNRNYDSFDRIVSTEDSSGLGCIFIPQIGEDHENSIYVACVNSIYVFNESERTFSKVLSVKYGDITSFIFDSEDNIWIGVSSNGGLYFYDRKQNKLSRYVFDENNPYSISNNSIMSLALKDNRIWIATSGGGINSFDINTRTARRYPANDDYAIYAKKVYVDNNNRLWTCDLTGLKLYDDTRDIFYGYYFNKNDPYTIKKSIVSIFQDRQGNYWTLHSPGGVGLCTMPKGFYNFSNNPAEFWHTTNENISAICEDEYGNLWLGNSFNGIDVFYWTKGRTVTYLYDDKNKYSLGKGSVNTIFRDSKNHMWIGTYFGGLQYFNEKSGRFITYKNDPNDTNSLACNDIRSVCEDSKGNLWLVVHGKGIDRFDKKRNRFIHYNYAHNNLTNDWAFQVLCDQNDNIWVASVWGLNKLVKDSDKFINYISDANDTNSLSDNNIICLFEDSGGDIWIGTTNGLNVYDSKRNLIRRINAPLKNNNICAILEDNSENIWVSTLSGISKIDREKLKTYNFDEKDGLLANEFNSRSVYKNSENGLFFGSIKGVNVFNPDSLKINKEEPHVVISNLKLFYEDITYYSPKSILKKQISITDTLFLKYKQKILTFEFTALNMIHPEKNQYKYMMEGFDSKWINVGNKREATYTNLNPGKYIFRVQASNNDGIWNEKGASLFIKVMPPWYRKWWFYGIVILSVAGFFTLFFYARTAQLIKQKELLTLKVRERTKELSDMNEELRIQSENLNNNNALLEERQQKIEEQAETLSSMNEELKLLNSSKDKFFSIIAHDLRGPFHNILGFADILTDDFDDLNESQKKDIAGNINISTKKVYGLLENLLKWAASQTNSISFNPESLNIKTLIEESMNVLNDMAKNKNIEIRLAKAEVENVYADKEMVKTVIRNLIGNALKFTLQGGLVEIEVIEDDRFARISVKDNGIGMDSTYLENLFSIESMQSRPGTENESGSGLGLILCKEYIEKNGGRLGVTSKIGTGSTFTFTLPLNA